MKMTGILAGARVSKNYTFRTLERKSGVCHVKAWRIENGITANPRWNDIIKIAKALDLDLNRLARVSDL